VRESDESDEPENPQSVDSAHREARGLVAWGVGLFFTCALVSWLAYLARTPLLLLYVGTLLALGVSRIVRRLEERGLPWRGRRLHPSRKGAIAIVYVGVVVVIVGALALAAPPFVSQARSLAHHAPELLDRGRAWLEARGIDTPPAGELANHLPGTSKVAGKAVAAASEVVGAVFAVVTVLVLSLYLLLDWAPLYRRVLSLVPRERRGQVREVSGRIVQKASDWLIGQAMLAGIIGATAALGLGLLGVPYFYVLAILAAFGEWIPYVGPLLTAIPAIGLAATESWSLALWTAVFFFAQQQLENHILVPRLMSRQMGLNAVVVLVALLIGGAWLGIVGVLLAVPTAAIAQVIVAELVEERTRASVPTDAALP
jgi:predicted PurR-regulated permease PerM